MLKHKKDGRSLSRDAQEYLRKQGIALWKKGKKVYQIADEFGVTQQAVYKWIKSYKKNGMKGLKKRKAPGAKPKLSTKEVKLLLKLLNKTADHYGFDTPLWDTKKIQQLISEKFNKQIHMSNVWKLLKRWKFSNQKPEKQAIEQDEKLVEQWIVKEWPKIKAHARRWQAIIYFQDESGVQLQNMLGKTWAPKGKTPIIKVTGQRGCIIVTSCISPGGRMLFRFEKETIKAPHHIEFLKQVLRSHSKRKIIMIEDRARPHIDQRVKNFVQQNKKRFAIYYLPSYAPKLNPDEHVWCRLKKDELKTHKAKNIDEFRALVFSKMQGIQRRKKVVKSFFYGPLFN